MDYLDNLNLENEMTYWDTYTDMLIDEALERMEKEDGI